MVGNHPLGVGFFQTGCGGGNINSGQRSKYLYRKFLRWPEVMFPPPHPSLKESYPQGAVSYDQRVHAERSVCTHIYTLTPSLTHLLSIRPSIHPSIQKPSIQKYIHAYIHAYTHMHTYIHKHTPSIHPSIHTHIYTCIHTCIHTHAYIHT
jgi:protein-tyrosine phosphatase